ncbi:MAG: hypothetical protein IKU37_03910 [Candidatus Gastranaerophilales bacterium]|nr:hypothetical protein [Candidatus Gastranaerophilales bacterium]
MKKRILILTQSFKHSARCVVGFDIDNNEFIRLVTLDEDIHFSLSAKHLIYSNNEKVKLLDIVEVDFIGKQYNLHQPENWIIDETKMFKKLDIPQNEKTNIFKQMRNFISNDECIYLNTNEFLTKEIYEKINKSIALYKIENVKFNIYQSSYSLNPKVKVSFEYNNQQYNNFSFTSDYSDFKDCKKALAIVTLPDGSDEFCIKNDRYYKFVAQIFKLPD